MLDHADIDSTQHIDEGDDNARDGVATDELGGTVHGSVEVGFLRDSHRGVRGPALR